MSRDSAIWLLTDSGDGRLLRVVPRAAASVALLLFAAWMPVEPVPIIPTRLPVKCTSASIAFQCSTLNGALGSKRPVEASLPGSAPSSVPRSRNCSCEESTSPLSVGRSPSLRYASVPERSLPPTRAVKSS